MSRVFDRVVNIAIGVACATVYVTLMAGVWGDLILNDIQARIIAAKSERP